MSHPTDQSQPEDQRHWRVFTDRDALHDRLTHELTAARAAVLDTAEDW